jgi:hypothetical protein
MAELLGAIVVWKIGSTPPKNPGTPLLRKISELQLGEKFVEIGTVSPKIRGKRNSIDILKDSEK